MKKTKAVDPVEKIVAIATETDSVFETIMALSLFLILGRCMEEHDTEPPTSWNTVGVMNQVEAALSNAYRNTLVEIMMSKQKEAS